jgi:aldehyde:ferredoxin oxidoreductase
MLPDVHCGAPGSFFCWTWSVVMYRGGYTDSTLRVNLTERNAVGEPLHLMVAGDFVDGASFCVKHLLNQVKAGIDLFHLDNKLIRTLGPFIGITVRCVSRTAATAKSPLTGTVRTNRTGLDACYALRVGT